MNVYQREIHQNLPRLLALFDFDRTAESYGLGDRFHWAWGLIDFANGTFQGAANGLARLVAYDLLPPGFDAERMVGKIGAIFEGTQRIIRPNGSLEEAFPFEGSFCVTALGAYDLLTAIEQLGDRIKDSKRVEYLEVVRPLIRFLHRSSETHAFISNHLATAVAALVKWEELSGQSGDARAKEILDQILQRQSSEGWYLEYDGADPGYQSLCTYYLADVHRLRPEWKLHESLKRSVEFLSYFVHPDGSFGGLYGSRNTRFFYPAGIEYLAETVPAAGAIARRMRESVAGQRVVTLSSIDEPNLMPMFNAYCWAATLEEPDSGLVLPIQTQPFRKSFSDSGLIVDRGSDHYTIVAGKKGGVVYHFENDRLAALDAGVVVEGRDGLKGSSQAIQKDARITEEESQLTIEADLLPILRRRAAPIPLLGLRVLSMTIMRWSLIREWIKQLMAWLLITRVGARMGTNRRCIQLGPKVAIKDETRCEAGFEVVADAESFVAIHMASQGYWQVQDEEAKV